MAKFFRSGGRVERPPLNEFIRTREVRLIDDEGVNHGVVSTFKALEMAKAKELDLLVVNPNQDPPTAKILDYGKHKFETEKKAKEAKKRQHTADLKEVKMRYKIDVHDFEVRMKSAKKFLIHGDKVKVIIMLRGREMQHKNLAFDLAQKFLDALTEGEVDYIIDKRPSLDGRNIIAILSPAK